MDVILFFTNRNTDVNKKYRVAVDVTGEFPFLVMSDGVQMPWYGQKVSVQIAMYISKKSTNSGASFGNTINLSNDDNSSNGPEIAVVGDNVDVVSTTC